MNSFVKPKYAPIPQPEQSVSGDKFSQLARKFGMVGSGDPDMPRLMRNDVGSTLQ